MFLNECDILPVYSVTQLNRHIRQWLERDVGIVSVEGEMSNVSQPTSGHVYFTLKDQNAQLRCVYFKQHHPRNEPHGAAHGQQVLVRGRLSVYEARGDYQLIVEELQLAGLGDLYRQFEVLKNKLAAQGLFDVTRKRPLPRFPQRIGVITSAHAAAWRDILVTLARRYPLATVVLYPSDVQGKLAPLQLKQALLRANQEATCDVLIVARGGGSLEDLWAFNDEAFALAIAASHIPVISGVGHETDFTIADFVADWRAATPTAAAEAATPDQADLYLSLNVLRTRLIHAIRRLLTQQTSRLDRMKPQLTSPERVMATYVQTIDYLERRLIASVQRSRISLQHQVHLASMRLHAQHPRRLMEETRLRVQRCEEALCVCIRFKIDHQKQKMTRYAATLHAVSPLATLDRGYALVTQGERVIVDYQQLDRLLPLHVRLASGQLTCQVLEIDTA